MIFRSRAVSELLSETAKTDQETASIRHANKVSPCPEPPIGSICVSRVRMIFLGGMDHLQVLLLLTCNEVSLVPMIKRLLSVQYRPK